MRSQMVSYHAFQPRSQGLLGFQLRARLLLRATILKVALALGTRLRANKSLCSKFPSPSSVLFRVSHGVVFQLGNVFCGNFLEPYAICLPPPQLRCKPICVGQYEKKENFGAVRNYARYVTKNEALEQG